MIKDIYQISRIIRISKGLVLGIFQYTYSVFLYDHFGGDATALKCVVSLAILTSVLTILLEVPTGALGDYIGRKKTVVLSFVLGALSLFLRTWIYFVPQFKLSLVMAIGAVVLMALSYTLFSGTFVAWVVDTIRERKSEEGHGAVLAWANSYLVCAKAIGALIGLVLYFHGFVFYAFALGCLAYVLCGLYCGLVMQETQSLHFYDGELLVQYSIRRMREIITTGYTVCTTNKPVTYLILMEAAYMTVIHIVCFLWPIAMKSNFGAKEMSPYWYFLVFSGFIASYFGAKGLEMLSRYYLKRTGERMSNSTLWAWFVCVCLVMAFPLAIQGIAKYYGLSNLYLFVGVMTLFNIGYGFLMPAHQTLINYYIPPHHSTERATIMSFSSVVTEVLLITVLFPASGSTGEDTIVGWILPASVLIILTIATNVLMKRYQCQTRIALAEMESASLIGE